MILNNLHGLDIFNGVRVGKANTKEDSPKNANIQDLNSFREWTIQQYQRLQNLEEDAIPNDE